MPMIDAMARISEIRSTIGTLNGESPRTAPVAAAPAATAAPSSETAAAFTKLLTEAASPAPRTQSTAPSTPASPAVAAATRGSTSPDAPVPASHSNKTVTEIFPAFASPAQGTTVPNPQGATGEDIVATARKYLGVPYVWGGNNPKTGLDCSSLVQTVFRDLGMDVPRTARQQMSYGAEIAKLADARPGDLIVTRGGRHIGVYIGDNQMLHAPRPGEDVQIRELFEKDKDIASIRRIVASAAGSAPVDVAPAGQRPAVDSTGIINMIAAAQSSLLAGGTR